MRLSKFNSEVIEQNKDTVDDLYPDNIIKGKSTFFYQKEINDLSDDDDEIISDYSGHHVALYKMDVNQLRQED